MRSTFASLRFFNYRLWFCGALVANVGTWMQRIGQNWLVLTELSDDSGLAVGIVTALQFAPFLLLGPWAGLLADRLPRRRLLVATQLGQAVLAFGLGALVLSGQAQLWHVYLFAFALGIVATFDGPVRQTFVAEMVPATYLANAVGLNSASFNAARLIGPGLAGLLIQAVGNGWVFLINGASFLATILSLVLMRDHELHHLPRAPRGRGQIREGLRYVLGRGDLKMIVLIMSVVSCLGLNFQLTTGLMARLVFDKGAGGYGLLGSLFAIGSLTGALLAARRERPRVRLVVAMTLLYGVVSAVSALSPSYWFFAVSGVLVGVVSLTLMTAANTAIQMNTDPGMRGRVISLYQMLFQGSSAIGSPLVGLVAEQWGARWSIGIGALACLLAGLLGAWWAARNWHLTLRVRGGLHSPVIINKPQDDPNTR